MILIPTIILIVGSANAKSKLKIVEFSIDTSGKVSTCGHNSWNLAVGAIYIVHIWPLNQELNTKHASTSYLSKGGNNYLK